VTYVTRDCADVLPSLDDKLMTNDQEVDHQARISASDLGLLVGVIRHYSNRPDLLEQLRNVAVILSDVSQDDGASAKVTIEYVIRSRRLRDRFSPEDLQTMIDLYRSGVTAKQVAEKFSASLRSVKRLFHKHDVHRRPGRL